MLQNLNLKNSIKFYSSPGVLENNFYPEKGSMNYRSQKLVFRSTPPNFTAALRYSN